MKLGAVRLSLIPSALGPRGAFRQDLQLHQGEIVIKEEGAGNEAEFRIWVDANNPVIRVETTSCNEGAALHEFD
jgi:alpha-L-fucosidase 2